MPLPKKIFTLTAGAVALALSLGTPQGAKAQAGTQYIGQMMLFGGNFCPREWAHANGALLPISQNSALFSIIGTMFGGDGRTTMGLPDLQGRVPIGQGTGPGLSNYRIGQKGGREDVTLTVTNLPSHNHTLMANSGFGDSYGPGNDTLAKLDRTADPKPPKIYQNAAPNTAMNAGSIGNNGGNLAFDVRTPYLGMTWCIALFGIYPSRS